jgi:alkanesulfonate monooxygenase SsuD/methylene tetrahydromethanopterin reductase-like flavin-dependent oxidoreductase (luciferase family)
MRAIFQREAPVSHQGKEISLPYDGPGATGLGKPLRSILHGDPALPIWLGSGSEATVKLTAELCDGWLPMHFVPGRMTEYRPWLEEGFVRAQAAGRDAGWHRFEIQAQVGVRITDDVAGALAAQKPGIALYVGGMGAREVNFHNEHMRRMGYADAAERIQELFLAGRKDEAIAAVPDEYVDERCLVGPEARIRERYGAWADSGITGLGLATRQPRALELLAECAREHPARGVDALARS